MIQNTIDSLLNLAKIDGLEPTGISMSDREWLKLREELRAVQRNSEAGALNKQIYYHNLPVYIARRDGIYLLFNHPPSKIPKICRSNDYTDGADESSSGGEMP